ncbi:(2Fe-2S) ferredoxin domain-containing protein [Desulfoscipio gibsoniae]|uniref:Ferredoxin n=1 Tax=Desulfoscipio gibsoniae DSM 7213 TaxID=767817 RepID=R4KJP7_9FIRM|nr:(2Fe-2S) ferredoxin domain-containing protein [Desulfoscipio gibsoniae]AGL01832.1 ferredoxin [Desulfoscipio gibsoniae DSM 7213]
MNKPKHHIFVCTSSRTNNLPKGLCQGKSAGEILSAFLEEIEDQGLSGEIYISNTGCLGLCDQGPVVIIYPDNVWYRGVTPGDVEEIMEEHILGGNIVERLLIK